MSSAVRPLTRDKLAAVFKTPETIRAFEAMVEDVGTTLPAAVAAVEVVANAAAADAAAAMLAAGDALAATVDLDVRVDVLEAASVAPGHFIEDEGAPLTQRSTMNFAGAGVTVTDAGGKTVVTIPGGGVGGGHVIEDEGIALAQQTTLNFVGAGVTVTDDGTKTVVTIPGGGGGGGGSSYFPSGF